MNDSTHHQKPIKINNLPSLSGGLPTTQKQHELFHVEKQAEFDGIEMGVLESGVPYLTGRGLARMCGIDHSSLHELAANWADERHKPRGKQIDQLLTQAGYTEDSLYLRSEHKGVEINAFTESVCLAMLEYYAFLAKEKKQEAIRAFRALARVKFREFIYEAVGYSPEQKVLDSWKHFHDRIDMTQDAAPDGFFGVFREIAIMIVPMIRAGIIISDKVVPDISVGKAWSSYWDEMQLSKNHGERTRYDHEYPLYYPQSKSNPQPSFAYPNGALGEFRNWLRKNYIASKFPTYLLNQAKKGTLQIGTANKALGAFGVAQIEHKPNKKTSPKL
jgi:hypothetical protein